MMNRCFTRREFVQKGLGLMGTTMTVPAFLSRTAWALTEPDDDKLTRSIPGVPDDRILVVVQMAGGNDGLNTVIPVRNDEYYRSRSRLSIKKQDVLKLNDELGLNPQAKGLKRLYDDGLLGIVQGVGYPNPNRSHFASTDIWQTGDPNRHTYTGWIGRYFDNTCKGSDPPDPKLGIALTREEPYGMIGKCFSPVTFTSASQLQWRPDKSNHDPQKIFEHLNQPSVRHGSGSGTITTLDFLRRVSFDTRINADQIRTAAMGSTAGPRTNLNNQLSMVARMIAAGLPTKVYYVSIGGFDTHANQLGRQNALLKQLGDALAAFFDNLKKMNLLENVLVMTFSEFGRRVAENASGGTDHGVAAPMFIAGRAVRPGLLSRHPSLKNLDHGDLKHTVDFRSVYACILHDWMGADAGKIIGGRFPKVNLLKT